MTDFSCVSGKVVIVTGGGSGIGKAIAKIFAQNKMKVVVANRRDEVGAAVVEEIRKDGGEASFVRVDVSNEESVKNLVASAVQTYGKLDGIVNNAGLGLPSMPIHEITTKDYDFVVDIDQKGVFFGTKYGAEAILRSRSKSGFIINTASTAGLTGTEGMALYTLAKHAVIGITKAAALDYAKHNITVNAICPGTVKTEIWAQAPQEYIDSFVRNVPAGRLADPVEIAYLALFLASDFSRYISGQSIAIDGASTAGTMQASTWANPDIDK
jgi:NAD(P)-dependent dehydrogenase (short-subunit alcohol dehydrogenase family)